MWPNAPCIREMASVRSSHRCTAVTAGVTALSPALRQLLERFRHVRFPQEAVTVTALHSWGEGAGWWSPECPAGAGHFPRALAHRSELGRLIPDVCCWKRARRRSFSLKHVTVSIWGCRGYFQCNNMEKEAWTSSGLLDTAAKNECVSSQSPHVRASSPARWHWR